MFGKLQQKWKVNSVQLALILLTFAIGGSVTGFVGKKIINVLSPRQDWLWTLIYIILVMIIWPVAVIIVSVFFGQYRFFSGYVGRLGEKMGLVRSRESIVGSEQPAVGSRQSAVGNRQSAVGSRQSAVGSHQESTLITDHSSLISHIAIFASGAGTNAQKIIEHFRNSTVAKISLVVCNKPGAGVIQIAKTENIPCLMIDKERFFRGDGYLPTLQENKIDLIVLAGFLWKIPTTILSAYPKKIINIHPALLPKFGGKGMYGQIVHDAVISANEKESGITIHYVDEHYDNGDIILQVKCPVLEGDNSETLAHRIHALEHANYPVVIEELVYQLRAARHEP